MKVVYDPSVLQPTATASSSTPGNGPENAIDGTTTTYWESAIGDSDAVGPWVQVDLTRLLKVYNIQITFDSIEVPSQLRILSSDAPTDSNYGTFASASSTAFDLISTITPVNNGTNTISLNAKTARYWRFQSTSSGQIRIKDITIYATSNIVNTTSRLNINGTMFYDGINDLIKLNVFEQVSKGINQLQFTINNKDGKYLSANYPVGSLCRAWIDGVQKLFGPLIEFIPVFSPTQGLIIEGTIHDNGDWLINNTLFQAWAGVPIADSTKSNDIISQGANSILGMTTNSVGVQLINANGVQQTTGGINTPFYQKADHIDAWKMLQNLQKRAVSGAWVLQNTGFDQGTVTTATLGLGLSSSDGFWTSYQTSAKFGGSVRDNSQGNPSPSGLLDTTQVIQGGVLSAALSNYGTGLSANNTYDGNIKNDTFYLFSEIFQPCLVNVADLNQSASFNLWVKEETPSVNDNDIVDIIVETVPSPGVTRRYHYLFYTGVGHSGALGSTFPPGNTTTDYYDSTHINVSGVTFSRNLYTDYGTAFGAAAANADIITTIRVRVLPFQNLGSQSTTRIWVDDISLSPTAGVNVPPVQYDFNVGIDSNGNATLNWFAQPRAGVDLNYRHLDSSNNLKWLKSFPDSDLNNISDFKFTKGDLYRTKTDVTVHGRQIREAKDGAVYDASISTTDIQYLAGQNPPHGSPFPTANIKSSADMAQFGRRVTQLRVNDSNFSDLSRTAIAQFNQTRTAEQRAIVTAKGNANLTPGYVVYVASDFSDIQGYYYIVTTEHKWSESGYETVLTLQDDRFRFANDFARVQADIANVFTTAPALKSKTFIKKGANLAGATPPNNSSNSNTSHLWQYTVDRDVLRLPFNFVPELAAITNVEVTTTRLLGLEGYGNLEPGDWVPDTPDSATGWDQVITINNHPNAPATNGEVQISTQQLVAQRFVMPVVSSGRLMFRLNGRIPTVASLTGTYLQAAIVQDTASGGTPNPFTNGQAFSASGTVAVLGWLGANIVNSLFGTPPSPAPSLSGWKNIPFSSIKQAGNDSVDASAVNVSALFIEVEGPAGGAFVPNQIYWLVLKASSGGVNNVYLQYQNNTGQYLNYFAAKQNGNNAAWASLGGAFGDNALWGYYFTQEALTSAGATGEGAGNKLTLWDSYTGNAYPFISPVSAVNGSTLGTDQQYSRSVFPTYVIARKNGFGQVDVSFAVSAGGATGPPGATPELPPDAKGYKSYGRWDYACTVSYFE